MDTTALTTRVRDIGDLVSVLRRQAESLERDIRLDASANGTEAAEAASALRRHLGRSCIAAMECATMLELAAQIAALPAGDEAGYHALCEAARRRRATA